MSERGVFAVDRGIFGHPVVGPKRPYCVTMAWLWLLSEAAWKPKTVRVAGKLVKIERGQVCHAVRYMAEAWGWPQTNVVRFLHTLKTGTMIGTQTGTGITIITICNYNEYQRVSLPKRNANGTQSGTRSEHDRNKEEDTKDIEEENTEADASVLPLETPPAPVKKPKRARPRTPFPEDWQPELTDAQRPMFERFRNHARDKGRLSANWPAAWKNWQTSKYNDPQQQRGNGNGRSALAAADKLIDQFGGPEAARRYVPGSAGPKIGPREGELDLRSSSANNRKLPS